MDYIRLLVWGTIECLIYTIFLRLSKSLWRILGHWANRVLYHFLKSNFLIKVVDQRLIWSRLSSAFRGWCSISEMRQISIGSPHLWFFCTPLYWHPKSTKSTFLGIGHQRVSSDVWFFQSLIESKSKGYDWRVCGSGWLSFEARCVWTEAEKQGF